MLKRVPKQELGWYASVKKIFGHFIQKVCTSVKVLKSGSIQDSLVTKVSSMFIIAAEIAVNGRRCTEQDVGAQVVPSCLAEFTVPAGYTRLDRYPVTGFEVLHFCSHLETMDYTSNNTNKRYLLTPKAGTYKD